MFGEDEVIRSHKSRADLLSIIIVLCFFMVLARLWYLQVYQGDELYRYSVENTLRREIVKAPRGMIFSRNNQLLVHNTPRFDAVVTPQYLQNKDHTLDKLSKILDMPKEDIEAVLKKNSGQARYRPVVIKKNITRKEVAVIETENEKMPGVSVRIFISREYKDEEIGSHTLGYIGEISQTKLPKYRKRDGYDYKLGDFIGQAGIEQEFDLFLRGDDGYQFMEVDASGRMRRVVKGKNIFEGIENKEAKPGNNIRLTIDRDIQKAAYDSLEGKVGSVVAIDTESGEVLAMVSRPSFNPTTFSKGITTKYWNTLINDERNPLRDRTIQEHYPPGSTFKTFTAIAALEENIVTPDQKMNCGPTFKLGRRVYHDWKASGHGVTDVYKSLKRSVDVYYYKIGTMLDIDVLADYAKKFGLGHRTGITLPRETTGLIPTKEWKLKRSGVEWQVGETLSCVIGQSFVLVTPLQLAMGYAAIANDGKLFKPHLVKEVFTNSGEVIKTFNPELVRQIEIKKENLDAVKKGLYQVVNEKGGTAWWYRGQGIRMSGKTGTAQVKSMTKKELFSKCEEMPMKHRNHGLFAGYAPFENPKIAVAAVVEHGCHGSSAAAPVVRDVITTYMKKYQPELYEKYKEEDKKKDAEVWRQIALEKKKKEEQERINVENADSPPIIENESDDE